MRTGTIKGIAPTSRKEGWTIKENELNKFIQQRLPESYATNVVKETNDTTTTMVVNDEAREKIRAEMWMELARTGFFEGYIEIKKSFVRACIQHRKYPKALEVEVWTRCLENSKAYKQPRVFYILDAFKFEGKRLLLDKNFESLDEQIMFSIIEYVRKQ